MRFRQVWNVLDWCLNLTRMSFRCHWFSINISCCSLAACQIFSSEFNLSITKQLIRQYLKTSCLTWWEKHNKMRSACSRLTYWYVPSCALGLMMQNVLILQLTNPQSPTPTLFPLFSAESDYETTKASVENYIINIADGDDSSQWPHKTISLRWANQSSSGLCGLRWCLKRSCPRANQGRW